MDIDRYDLVLNTGALDLDTAADVIVAAYRAKLARVLGAVS
jgi:cytidylate kinase